MDHAFQGRHPPSQLSAMVATSNQIVDNSPWYADSAANQHITANLENLSLQQPYSGSNDVVVGNDTGLSIQNTGSMSFHTPKSSFYLSQVLHCPKVFILASTFVGICHRRTLEFVDSPSLPSKVPNFGIRLPKSGRSSRIPTVLAGFR